MSFKFKYSLEDMFTGAVETCREKGLLPKPQETTVNGLLPKPPETTKKNLDEQANPHIYCHRGRHAAR
ncbi:hypothetical protein JHK87_039022 [Glycine soja]|nr:hypothetical protein JHK87_039022 [Glycine soja]